MTRSDEADEVMALEVGVDELDHTRLIVQLAGGYEWQTKGNGSTVRIYDPITNDWKPISWHPDWIEKVLDKCVIAQNVEINRLRTQLADAQAQLAAERSMSAKLYECLSDVSYEATPNIYGDVEMYDGTEMKKFINEAGIVPYQEHLATRQPTQDKGSRDGKAIT